MPVPARPLADPIRPATPRPSFAPPPAAALPAIADLDDLSLARLGATVLRALITRGRFTPRLAGAPLAPADLWLVCTDRGTALELHCAPPGR